MRLAKAAWRSGYRGLACVIAVTWDTAFQPGDARTLRARHLSRPKAGPLYFDKTQDGREKTGVAAIGTVSRRTARMVDAYLDGLGVELHGEAFLFRNRSGVPYSMFKLCEDFATIREVLFPGDKRQLRDMRRSGAAEAVVGAVAPGALAAKMANSVDQSARIWKTYVPVDAEAVRAADRARIAGRQRLRLGEKLH